MTRFREDEGRPSRTAWLRDEGRNLAEISGLVGFAIVQPVLGAFGESPETFTAAGAEPGDIVRFALAVALVPIALLWGLTAATRAFGERVRSVAQTVVVAALTSFAVVAIARAFGAGPALRLVLAFWAAGLAAWLHRGAPAARMFLRYTAPVPALLVVSFLFLSSVAPLVRPSSAEVASTSATAADRPPVVMIVLDELPTLSIVDGTGGIDAGLLPNLARLAETSTWYRNHTAVAPATGMSLPSLLTGSLPTDPSDMRAATADQYPDNLITLLGETHEVHGREWATSLCGRLCEGGADELDDDALRLLDRQLGDGRGALDLLVDQARTLWWSEVFPPSEGFDGGFALGLTDPDDLSRQSLEFLSGLAEPSGSRPTFDYLHSTLPHQPWWVLPSGRSYDAPEVAFGGEFLRAWTGEEDGADVAEAARVRHRLQLQWADRIVGAVIDRLERLGRWDESVVVVTADHGISFDAGTSTRDTNVDNQVGIAWTPLLVKLPGQRDGAVDDTSVTALDVVPTILDVVDVEAPWEIEGRSLARGAVEPVDPKPFILQETDRGFPTTLRPGIVALEADGLARIATGGGPAVAPDDPLGVWRHGRHGDLLGRDIAGLGVCAEPGPVASRSVPDAWDDLVAGTLDEGASLPLWQAGTLDSESAIDLAVVVDGTVAGWGRTLPRDTGQRFGVLVAEPLALTASGDPELFQIVDDLACRLRPIEG